MSTERKQLKVTIGTPVIGADGKQIGDVDGVVLNPENDRVRTIFMRKGRITHSDQSFGVQSVTRIDEDGLHVSFTRDDANMMDHYMDSDYLTPSQTYFRGHSENLLPVTDMERGAMSSEEVDQQLFDEHLGSEQRLMEFMRGAAVVDKEGVELGKIADLAAVTGGEITALRVDQGRFRHTERWIPIQLVSEGSQERVTLSTTLAELDASASSMTVVNPSEGFALDKD